jgi:hypothetical protein
MSSEDRADMISTAREFAFSDAFVDSIYKIGENYLDFADAVRALADQTFYGSGTGLSTNRVAQTTADGAAGAQLMPKPTTPLGRTR